ncbi:MAG: DUF4832 domain-containing protein [Lachnospiraceae bacterium]|nr:DUF4832 domain-containing protein [Lachnospiraceae bacterium]
MDKKRLGNRTFHLFYKKQDAVEDAGLRKKINENRPYLLLAVMVVVILVLMIKVLPDRYGLNQTVTFEESDAVLANPLTGFAPRAESETACEDTQLVYIGLTWAEWEPTEGEYAVQALEEKFHIEQWMEEGKHAVLRFMCDVPGDSEHMDIPEWLYRQTMDGSFYTTAYGSGYSPNYENITFRTAHKAAIEALARYCNESDFVAYVELGSLGHWGEWHVNGDVEDMGMPDADVCREYVLDYARAFRNARLLMRRNYTMVSDEGLGLYNDMTGDEESTLTWLDWIENGGSQKTDGDALELQPLENFWETGPVGGEFGGDVSLEELLGEYFDQTLQLIEETHMTFIGPNCPTGELAETDEAQEVLKRLGYRFYISGLRTTYSLLQNEMKITLTWENTGLAPMYWDWLVTMYVYDQDGEMIYWDTVDMDLTQLMPGTQIVTENSFPFSDQFSSGFMIGIGISNPNNIDENIRLAMDVEEMDQVQILYIYERP